MPHAISYVRFSSLRQRKGTSIERQEQMIGAWLTQHPEYDLSSLQYKDLGRSGYKGEHIKGGGFGKLLDAVQQGAIKAGDAVLVEAIDRTGRMDTVDMLDLLTPILKAGVSIITLDDGNTYNRESVNGSHIYMLMAKIQAAHQYSAALSRRITATYEKRKQQAKAGVSPKRSTPVWLTSEGVLIEPVAEQIRMAFDLYISGVGKSTIAKRMRECGVPELAKTTGTAVGRWINNRTAIGEWEVHKLDDSRPTEIIQNAYPSVVSLSTFQKAQMHRERVATKPVKRTAKHFLVGLMKCGVCGKNYIVQHRKGKTSSVRCRTNQMAGDCTNTAQLPLPIIQALMAYCSDPWKHKAVSSLSTGVNEVEIASLRADIESYTAKIKALTDSVRSIGALPELLQALQEDVEARDSASARIAILERSLTAPQESVTEADVRAIEVEDPQRLSSLLQQVGFTIMVHPDKTLIASGTDVVWRYKGKDRSSNRFVLQGRDKLYMIGAQDYCDTGLIRRVEEEHDVCAEECK